MDDANDIGTAQRALAECAYFLRAVHAEAALRGVSEAEIYSYVRTHGPARRCAAAAGGPRRGPRAPRRQSPRLPLSSVVADTEALMRFQPDVLLARLHDDPSEDIGAVKLLQRLWPAMVVGVLADTSSEVSMGPVAAAIREAGESWREPVRDAVQDAMRPFAGEDGVVLGASCWRVFARKPD